MTLTSLLVRALSYTVGLLSLSIWSLLAIWHGQLPGKPSRPDKETRKGLHQHHLLFPLPPLLRRTPANDPPSAQQSLWSLTTSAEKQHYTHAFLPLRAGLRLHYLASILTPPPTNRTNTKTLIIFLHGFPDSSHIFAHHLSPPLTRHAQLIALDLPGFGGSDALPTYAADEVLNALVAAILQLKSRYLPRAGEGKCVLVGHDWGAALTARLATETTGLLDRAVLLNGPVPTLFAGNLAAGVAAGGGALRRRAALREAKETLAPVLTQLIKSNYVFLFTLPLPVSFRRRLSFVLEFLISLCHRSAAAGREEDSTMAAWSWAASIGPSIEACATTTPSGEGYGDSVRSRAERFPRGDWEMRTKLYREGLFSGGWTLRHETLGHGVQQVGNEGGFQCPASVVFGLRDFALDYRICVRGVGRLFKVVEGKRKDGEGGNHVILLEECGHWSPVEETGTGVLRELLMEVMDLTTDGPRTMEKPTVRRSDYR